METYEGLVRKVYTSKTKPAVLLVHNVFYNNGANAQLMHGRIARYYNLPAVSMQSTIYPEVVAGRIETVRSHRMTCIRMMPDMHLSHR